MFGNVNILKDELLVKDFYLFRAYYCGLCKAMGRHHNQVARLGLSYDMAFLAIVLSSVSDEETKISKQSCFLHPLNKKPIVCDSPVMEYCADMSVLLSHLKLIDDIRDDKSIKAMFLSLFSAFSARRIKKKRKREYFLIEENLKNLSKLENENCPEADRTADCFAKITEALFTPDFIENEELLKNLGELGYNIGRWIYLVDALCDMPKDLKKNSYNPYLAGNNKDIGSIELALTLTLSNISDTCKKIKFTKCGNIIDNIVHLGILNKQNDILKNVRNKFERK